VLTDNGKAFTDRLFGSPDRQPTGTHEFDQLCEALGIEHRLTKPGTPQTNGMVERFNGRISDILKTHHFLSGEDLAQTLPRYVFLYNNQLPQSALGSQTPTQTMQKWFISNPEIFHRNPDDQTGCDSGGKATTYPAVRNSGATSLKSAAPQLPASGADASASTPESSGKRAWAA